MNCTRRSAVARAVCIRKFDQHKREYPTRRSHKPFRASFGQFWARDTELNAWRHDFLAALTPNGQLIVDLIPELKVIIGEQPPVPALPLQHAQSRFHSVFKQFIGVFARPEHPLVLFLDDLQWLDAATFELLEDLSTRSDLKCLMLIGAYRDNEVDSTHPVMRMLDAVKAAAER
jgi:predicted ATPase